jgi:integrase
MLSLKWSDINLELGFAFFPDTKNGSHRIPLVTQAKEILENMPRSPNSDFVFPSDTSKSGHIEDFHRPWYALLKRAGIEDFRVHDMRRTFGSYQAMIGSGEFILGKALGDKTLAAVKVYARVDLDPVRNSMQQGMDKMLGFVKTDNI